MPHSNEIVVEPQRSKWPHATPLQQKLPWTSSGYSYTERFAREFWASKMPDALQVIACQAPNCRTEIVLPFLSPLENFPLVPSGAGDPYLDIACPRCGHVFRYTSALSRQLVSDTPYPYRRPASAVWFRVWLKCAGTPCTSRVQVDSAMTNAGIEEGVKTLVRHWRVDDAVKCGIGHQASQPLETMWAGIVCPGWTMLPDSPR